MGGTLELALLDHVALVEVAKSAGVPVDRARDLCAALSELPPDQIVRILGKAGQVKRLGLERARRRTGR
jgi:hypothetical protein